MVSDSLFATSKRDELIALMKRAEKAMNTPNEKWGQRGWDEFTKVISPRLCQLYDELGATWAWAGVEW